VVVVLCVLAMNGWMGAQVSPPFQYFDDLSPDFAGRANWVRGGFEPKESGVLMRFTRKAPQACSVITCMSYLENS
jgi:hypothetical protein